MKKLVAKAVEAYEGAADLFFGAACPGCGAPGLGVCDECMKEARRQQIIRRNLRGDLTVFAACEYRNPVRRLILAHKNRSAWWLSKPLAKLLAEKISVPSKVTLCPIPSDASAVRKRGYDHSFQLAKEISNLSGCQVKRLLRRSKAAGDQIGRDKADRARAQRNTMSLARHCSGQVLLLDDVVTTGATLREAHRVLKDAGISCVNAVTIASTGLRLASFQDEKVNKAVTFT